VTFRGRDEPDVEGKLGMTILSNGLHVGTIQERCDFFHGEGVIRGFRSSREDKVLTSILRMGMKIVAKVVDEGRVNLEGFSKARKAMKNEGHNELTTPVIDELDGCSRSRKDLAERDNNRIEGKITVKASGRETKYKAHVRQRKRTKIRANNLLVQSRRRVRLLDDSSRRCRSSGQIW